MNIETSQLKEYLHKIARKSLDGQIPWSQPNPSTFQWVQISDDKYFIVTIQKAETPRSLKAKFSLDQLLDGESVYLFQVQDRTNKQTEISLSSKERPDFFEPLAAIYHGAEKGMDVRATNVLRRLLD
ncbi:hypothetical protein P0C22_15980 [Plesiomonas shigelloides]|uniref:hypothetical protein n=1 Tax=Plesiomonas shigelloides TaxID=703 RepID=UPI0030BE6EFC